MEEPSNSLEITEPKPSSLLKQKQLLDQVRNFYLLHETNQSRSILSTSQDILDQLRKSGEATLWIGGSVGFGQATDDTDDLDFVYVGDNPPEFRRQVGTFVAQFQKAGINLEHLDYDDIDLRLVRAYLTSR